MKTIWKFPVEITDHYSIEMPTGAALLSVQTQGSAPCLWALVDDAAPKVRRGFALRGTGHECNGLNAGKFVGTFQLKGGMLVFHLFDLGESKS